MLVVHGGHSGVRSHSLDIKSVLHVQLCFVPVFLRAWFQFGSLAHDQVPGLGEVMHGLALQLVGNMPDIAKWAITLVLERLR